MKTTKRFFLIPLLLMGTVLFFATGCSDDDEASPDAEVSMFTLLNFNTHTEASVDMTGDVLLRFKGEVNKPATVKVHRTHNDTGNEEVIFDIDADGAFSIVEDVVYMEPGEYTLYGEITVDGTTYRTEDELTVTVSDEKVDVGDNFTIGLDDVNQDSDQLLMGRRYALAINWWLGPGEEPTNTRVEWESSDESIATVEVEPGAYNDGYVYIHGPGSFRLTATSEEKPNLTFGKDFTAVESVSDDTPEITVNSTSTSAQIVDGVGNSATVIKFTVESEQDDPDPAEEHQWFGVNFAYDAEGVSQTIEYSVPKANVDRKEMPSGSGQDSYWLEAGTYTIQLWAPMAEDVSVPVRVWVSDAQVDAP
ncbi:MAG: hypothetical protein ACQESX_04885 [Bacteroidota bacterium]